MPITSAPAPTPTFDTIGGLVSAQATSRLSFTFHGNYSSDLSAQYVSQILNNGADVNGETKNASFTSNYLNYGVTSGYIIAPHLTATGSINHRAQGQPGFPDSSNTIMNTGISWAHELLGGSFGAHYGISYYFRLCGSRQRSDGYERLHFHWPQWVGLLRTTLAGFDGSGSFSYAGT